ncbi:fra a 1-associated protein [Humulus lupulus]|uniref:fra a 1-associated protein n=1 Tax=Humulus lupulus TaxID=3486 RepID=UPI002B41524D|nr:fra a 1-associated protein [Humulus lupulus]
MGWVWRDDEPGDLESPPAGDIARFQNPIPRADGDRCTTRRVVSSQCMTEEVEPGKFVRKCEKTEQLLRDCVGRPVEIVQSNKEYTEDDVTDRVLRGSFPLGSSEQGSLDFPGLRNDINSIGRHFNFPGLRDDIDTFERNLFGSIGRFFEAAEDLRDGFFSAFRDPRIFDGDSSSASKHGGVPIESNPQKGEGRSNHKSGDIDLSGLTRDV